MRSAGSQQPPGQRGVQAPGHRVLRPVAPSFGKNARTSNAVRRARRDRDRRSPTSRSSEPGLTASTASALSSSDGHPARAVVDPLGVDDLRAVDPEHRREALDQRRLVDRARSAPAAARRRRARRACGARATSPAAHSCTITPASRGEPPASSHAWQVPSVGCPANGSSLHGREDPHPVVGAGVLGRQHERRLRQVRPVARRAASPRRSVPRRRARPRRGCRGTARSVKTSTWRKGRSMPPSLLS